MYCNNCQCVVIVPGRINFWRKAEFSFKVNSKHSFCLRLNTKMEFTMVLPSSSLSTLKLKLVKRTWTEII